MDKDQDPAEAPSESGGDTTEGEAIYEFEGFDVQVNERIALTPAAAARGVGHG